MSKSGQYTHSATLHFINETCGKEHERNYVKLTPFDEMIEILYMITAFSL